jgi:hypothetical protein
MRLDVVYVVVLLLPASSCSIWYWRAKGALALHEDPNFLPR